MNGTLREAEERGVSRKEGGEAASRDTKPVGRQGRWSKGKSQRVWHGSRCHNLKVNSVEKEEKRGGEVVLK